MPDNLSEDRPFLVLPGRPPSFWCDGITGTVHAGGVVRLILGELTLDDRPGAKMPALRYSVQINMTADVALTVARQITEYVQNEMGVVADGDDEE